jgi:hypothetical protein
MSAMIDQKTGVTLSAPVSGHAAHDAPLAEITAVNVLIKITRSSYRDLNLM